MRKTNVNRHIRKTRQGKIIIRRHSRRLHNRAALMVKKISPEYVPKGKGFLAQKELEQEPVMEFEGIEIIPEDELELDMEGNPYFAQPEFEDKYPLTDSGFRFRKKITPSTSFDVIKVSDATSTGITKKFKKGGSFGISTQEIGPETQDRAMQFIGGNLIAFQNALKDIQVPEAVEKSMREVVVTPEHKRDIKIIPLERKEFSSLDSPYTLISHYAKVFDISPEDLATVISTSESEEEAYKKIRAIQKGA